MRKSRKPRQRLTPDLRRIEAFGIAILIQSRKLSQSPVVMMGREYWEPLRQFIRSRLVKMNLITEADLAIVKITDDVDEAVELIKARIKPRSAYP